MKKWLCLLMTVFVFASVSIAMAEETPDPNQAEAQDPNQEEILDPNQANVRETEPVIESDFINVPFGAPVDTQADSIRELWEFNSAVTFTGDPVWDEKTLSSGIQYKELTLTGESSYGFALEAKYYYNSDGMLIASSQVYTISDEANALAPKASMTNIFGQPQALRLARIGDFAELFGESCHLEDGQDMWKYKTQLKIPDVNLTANVVLTMRIIDDRMYLAAFLDPEGAGKTVGGSFHTEDLKGYKELTPEQQQAVDMYAEYLESQIKGKIEEYIAFLGKKH